MGKPVYILKSLPCNSISVGNGSMKRIMKMILGVKRRRDIKVDMGKVNEQYDVVSEEGLVDNRMECQYFDCTPQRENKGALMAQQSKHKDRPQNVL